MNGPTSSLTCPKCAGEMRSYERNGVTVDQCTECRGIFLDRGELERLVDAENSHYEREYSDRGRGHEERPPSDYEKHGRKPKKSKKKSFLENLMEGMGE
jgi:Zn-finger nucleic acid-binding protein